MTAAIADVQARMAAIQARFAVSSGPIGRAPAAAGIPAPAGGASFEAALGRALAPAPAAGHGLRASWAAGAGPAGAATATGGRGGVTGEQVVAAARRYLGVPYVWGGTDPALGLDCSGFIQRTYKDLGIDLPRVSADQARAGTPVASLAEARPGDLVAFDWSTERPGIDHIGIYAGDGKMIVAPRTGDVVKVQEITRPPVAIRRILAEPSAATAAAAGTVAPATPYAALFEAAGGRHGVSPTLLAAVARAESGFNPRAVSAAGAQGLMQLMPGTARDLGVANPFDPRQAVDGAARLLATHLRDFGSVELALAAYNAGPGAVRRHGGVPPFRETQGYVARILQELA